MTNLSIALLFMFSFNLKANFKQEIDKLKKIHGLNAEQIGFSVFDIEKNKMEFSYNKNETFYPASVFKVFTAYYVLKKFGPQKKFKTSLYHSGEVKNGVLFGDIIIESEGDPYLLTNDLYDMIFSLKRLGVKEIKGSLKVVKTLPNFERISNIGLDDQPYNQSISSFNVNFNRFKAIKSGNAYVPLPQFEYLKISKTKTPLSPGEVFQLDENSKQENWKVYKTSKWYYEVPVRRSLGFNSSYFLGLLKRNGIKNSGKFSLIASIPSDTIGIYSKNSLSVSRLIELGMEYSNNFFMEILLLKATKTSTLKEAANLMKKYYVSNFDELAFNGVDFDRASGLTVKTELPIGLMERFLGEVSFERFGNNHFITYLSMAGTGGFFAKKFLNSTTHESFFAKSGSMDYVNNLCGFMIGQRQRTFCIYINDKKKRKLLQGRNTKKLEKLREDAKRWYKRSSNFSEELILKYLKK